MAEKADQDKESVQQGPVGDSKGSSTSPLILGVLVLNIFAFFGVGYLVYTSQKKNLEKPSLEPLTEGIKEEKKSIVDEPTYSIPLDYFLVNLAEDQGHKLFKVKMEFIVDKPEVLEEINNKMPQVRDIIIILASTRTHDQISKVGGKEKLRAEIGDTVNSFLTKGRIKKVLFTSFIYN